ncbi:glycosyltransferase family protein [Streptomyces lasiicapitis]|uniref:hypothetical protein n=1 Tax=Streptomyces lasiicapitis TaxID=1923961 RepID=UPI00365ED2E4
MNTLATAVLWAVLGWGALLTGRAVVTARALQAARRTPVPAPGEGAPHVALLIPALREQDLLSEVVGAVACLDYPSELLHIVVITTEREERDRRAHLAELPDLERLLRAAPDDATAGAHLSGIVPSSRARDVAARVRTATEPSRVLRDEITATPTTRDVASALIPEIAAHHPKTALHHLHYDDPSGAKSSQLVYAVERLGDLLPGEAVPDRTYVGVYDADSQPDRTTLRHLAHETDKAHRVGHAPPTLVQQLPLQLRRPHAARPGVADLVLRAHAVADLRRRMGIEAHRLRARARLRALRLPDGLRTALDPVVYGIGAGLFVRHDKLVSIGMYEEPVDDLLVGYKLSAAGESAVVLPVHNLVDRYARVGALAKAYSLVALGSVAGCLRLLRDPALRAYGPRNTVTLVKEGLDTVWWFVGPPCVAAAVAVLAVHGAHRPLLTWAVAAAAYMVLHALISTILATRFLERHEGAHARAEPPVGGGAPGLLLPLMFLQPVLHWLGPLRLATARALGPLARRPLAMGKTER